MRKADDDSRGDVCKYECTTGHQIDRTGMGSRRAIDYNQVFCSCGVLDKKKCS